MGMRLSIRFHLSMTSSAKGLAVSRSPAAAWTNAAVLMAGNRACGSPSARPISTPRAASCLAPTRSPRATRMWALISSAVSSGDTSRSFGDHRLRAGESLVPIPQSISRAKHVRSCKPEQRRKSESLGGGDRAGLHLEGTPATSPVMKSTEPRLLYARVTSGEFISSPSAALA